MLSQTRLKTPREISELDAQHVLVPWKKQGGPRGLPITRAEGVYFWNADGKRFLDLTSQFVFTNFGHGERRVVDAIARQAAELPVMASSFVTAARAEAAQAIAEVTPGDLNRVFFSTSGAEANEAAMKFARDLTGRPLIVSRHRSYHGSTFGAMTLSRDDRSWPFEPALPGVMSAPLCDPYRCPFAPPGERCTDCAGHCVSLLEDVLQQYGPHRVAAIIVEPITGSNGLIVPADDYLKQLREVCDKYGILLICDEVMTGFGRTGRWFASELFGIVPDIMTMAKGLTGGYVPLGATVVREGLAKQWDTRPLLHGHTYSNHALACAAASAAIAVYRDDHLVERCAEVGPYLLQRAEWLMSRHSSIGDVRGKGLFVGMELVRNRTTKQRLIETGAPSPTVKDRVLAKAMEEGVYVMAGQASNVIVMTPPLTITREQIDEGVDVLDRALALADAEVETSSTW
ncbi:aminotransferase class III-fold pyridoxal phosphate-dependent enzyme [bacterium]|nr:MAG: aminotransferase class III-fold pyridoxal phosphate-dependent enzyme [bacterium]